MFLSKLVLFKYSLKTFSKFQNTWLGFFSFTKTFLFEFSCISVYNDLIFSKLKQNDSTSVSQKDFNRPKTKLLVYYFHGKQNFCSEFEWQLKKKQDFLWNRYYFPTYFDRNKQWENSEFLLHPLKSVSQSFIPIIQMPFLTVFFRFSEPPKSNHILKTAFPSVATLFWDPCSSSATS